MTLAERARAELDLAAHPAALEGDRDEAYLHAEIGVGLAVLAAGEELAAIRRQLERGSRVGL